VNNPGLKEEYQPGSILDTGVTEMEQLVKPDEPSVMAGGEEIGPRHYQPFVDWLNASLPGCSYAVK
jgi:hypothetical protein